jgi:hypothetical protein
MACWNVIPADWQRAWQLTRQERWIFLRALVMLPLTAVAIRCLGLRRWQRFLLRCLGRTAGDRAAVVMTEALHEQARQTARLVAAARRRGFWRGNCLQHSVVLWYSLVGRGLPGELRIGVRFETGQLAAHAWVSCGGVVLNERDEELRSFAAFDRPILPPREVL